MAIPIHSMIRVLDEERSRNFYADAFDFEMADRFDFEDFTLIYLRAPEAGFELGLTVNAGRTEPYDLGDGYGHLSLAVDDLEEMHRRLNAHGFVPRKIKTLEHDGRLLGKFFFVCDPDGYQIEVLKRQGRFG